MIHTLPRIFVLTVRKTWQRWLTTQAHLEKQGIPGAEPFIGFDKFVWQFSTEYTFDLNAPGERLGWGPLATYLSHYMVWKTLSYLPEDVFWVLEDDAEFIDNWRYVYSEAMKSLPDDWDVVFLGSCCAEGVGGHPIGPCLWDVRWPLCGHAMMYRKKAFGTLLSIHQKIWAPLDIAMKMDSLPHLKVFTILPRIVNQRGSSIPP
jgi:hypothetical protein